MGSTVSKKDDAEVIREVTACIEHAIAKNRRQEWVAISILATLFSVGLSLFIYGALAHFWELLIPGGLAQVTIFRTSPLAD